MKIPKNYSLQVRCYTHEDDGDAPPDFVILKKEMSSNPNIWYLYSIQNGEIDKEIAKADTPIKLYKKVWE